MFMGESILYCLNKANIIIAEDQMGALKGEVVILKVKKTESANRM